MKKIMVLAVAVLVVVCMAVPAFAASKIGAGTSELNVFGNLGSSENKMNGQKVSTDVSTNVSVGYGYFVTDLIQVGVSLQEFLTETKPEGGSTSKSGVTYVQLDGKFHFYSKGATVVPYVGASVGQATMTSSSGGSSSNASGTMVTGRAGVKMFVSENTSVNLELNIAQYETKVSGSDFKMKTNTVTGQVGLSTYF